MKKFLVLFVILALHLSGAVKLKAKLIEVCGTCSIRNLQDAAKNVEPGDTILVRAGIYSSPNYISNLKGTAEKWITITAPKGEEAIFKGQSTAMQLSDPTYLLISNLIFDAQTMNGVNIDDGGSYDSPSHNIIIENCEWRGINATGNNDLLKMSGVDNFIIRNCKFKNGSPGGSGIDMVGCHNGVIEKCIFENQGSNSIQNKGGTSQITIQKNLFINGGMRSLNIGGSTGLDYFRPLNAKYEAKEIKVYSNIFVGSQSPIAFVGAINCEVVNNTIYLPTKWAIRILQENTNEGFAKCANNSFVNNIVYVNNSAANPTINIGINTEPSSFYFANNFWYNRDNKNWAGANLPVSELNGIKNIDPMISEDSEKGITIEKSSPVLGKGVEREMPREDYNGNLFNSPRSIGAIEVNPKSNSVFDNLDKMVYPNPATNHIYIQTSKILEKHQNDFTEISIYNLEGECVFRTKVIYADNLKINLTHLSSGIYLINIEDKLIKLIIEK